MTLLKDASKSFRISANFGSWIRFIVSFGFGILLVDQLNLIEFFGFKLGFWFAQQGSIYTFVILIFIYIYLMNKLDKEFKS